jgi:hypothetical protein
VPATPCAHRSTDCARHRTARSRRSSRRRSIPRTEARCQNCSPACDSCSDITYYTIDDDMMSGTSVDVGADSDRDTVESRCPHNQYSPWWACRHVMRFGRR